MTKPKWENITVRLGDLRPWADNPRLSTKAQAQRIIKSFEKFGQVITVAVDPDLEVLDGHQRLSALLTIYGEDYKIDARQSDRKLELQERKELVINLHTGAVGSWDWSELANSWSAGDLQEWGMTKDVVKDWSNDIQNLKELLAAEVEPVDAEPQIDRAAELQEKWQTASGQLWKLGDHRLLIGDCTVRENVERLMGGERADCVFTDPPYGVGMNIENDDLKGLEFDNFNTAWIKEIPLANNCGFVCYHSTRTFPSVLKIATESGWNFERMLWYYVPDKFPAHSWKHWMMVSQAIMLFSFGDVLYADTQSDQDCYKMTSADLGISNGHPTEKRAENCQRVMSHYGGVNIYEPFAGSGTTIIAAHNLNRRCFAMEISPNYGGVILERFATATGITPELVG